MFAVLITASFTPSAFALQEWVRVSTDKAEYNDGDTVVIKGDVFQLYSSFPMSVMVIAPNDNVVYLDQISVNSDKKFTTEFKAGGKLMKMAGEYKIIVQYGSESRKAETKFFFGEPIAEKPEPIEPVSLPRQITIDGYNMATTMTSGEVINMVPNRDTKTLTIDVHDTDETGAMTIAIPRAVLDSTTERGTDSEFFVFVDGQNVKTLELDSSEFERTLLIDYPAGARTIEIVGTFAIPEFGTIAMIILAISIVSIILVTNRTKISLVAKMH